MSLVSVEVGRNLNIVMENKVIKLFILTCFFMSFAEASTAQTEGKGKVTIEADSMLKVVTNGRVWSRPDKITGYRVLLYTGGRAEAQKVMQDFRNMFPDQPVMLKWDEPNFKVVGGLFYSKNDARVFRKKCSRKFPMLIIVNDLVDLPPVDDRKSTDDSDDD